MNDLTLHEHKLWTPQFISVGATNLLFFLQHYIMIAAMPLFILNTLHGDDMAAGMAMTFFQVGTVGCRPFAGMIIDAMHKKKLLIITAFVIFMLMIGFFSWQSLTGLYILRIIHGVFFAIATTVAATIAVLVIPVTRKGEGLGYFALSTNLAMVVGPLCGLLLIGKLGNTALFGFLIIAAAVSLYLSCSVKLSDKIVLPKITKDHSHFKFSFNSFIAKEAIPWAVLAGFLYFVYGGILTFIPLYANSLGLATETSLFFSAFAFIIVLTRPFIGRIFDEMGPAYTIYPGFAFFAIGLILFGNISSMTSMLVSAIVLGVGFGALSPAFQTLAVRSVPPERSGVATATYFWSLDISVGLAAVLLAQVSNQFGYSFMYGILSPAVIVLTCILYFFIAKRHL